LTIRVDNPVIDLVINPIVDLVVDPIVDPVVDPVPVVDLDGSQSVGAQ
jgi:hypothetical protein